MKISEAVARFGSSPLPPGTRYYAFEGRATGHGRRSAGTPIPQGDPDGYDVSGRVIEVIPCGPSKLYRIGDLPSGGIAGGWQEIHLSHGSTVCPACGGDPMLCECQTAAAVDVLQYGERRHAP